MRSIAAVVATRNRRDSLAAMLELVRADDFDEIVVVDDGSTDGTPALLDQLAHEDPRVRAVPRNGGGAARARQAGAEAATSDVLLLLDDDVRPQPGLAAGHRAHHEVPGRVVLGYMPTGAPAGRSLDEVPVEIYRRDYEAQVAGYEADPANVLLDLWAGNVSIRRADALRVGLVGPVPFAYHEDKDFGFRCADAGLTGVFDRTLVAEHHPTRPFDQFLQTALHQGADLVRLHQAHPSRCPLDERRVGAELPRLARIALRPTTVPLVGAAELRLLALVVGLFRWRRMHRAQIGAAVLARTIAQRRGVRVERRLRGV